MNKGLLLKLNAGVAQWQSSSFPSYVLQRCFNTLGAPRQHFTTLENNRLSQSACPVRVHEHAVIANQNRPRHWRASSSSCLCNVTPAPCWVCEQSAECVECGSIELMDEMEVSKHGYMCSLCDDARWVS